MFSVTASVLTYLCSVMGVISASIGSAAGVYVLVAITGYMTFGNDVIGNIVSMCMFFLYFHDPAWRRLTCLR